VRPPNGLERLPRRANRRPDTEMPQTTVTSSHGSRPVRLSQLRTGSTARLHATELAVEDCALLRALGLTDHCLLRVCKAGAPCIVQVRTTRIGLSREVARGLLVIPVAAA
jgi:Fe2+ transport system protein FeoA